MADSDSPERNIYGVRKANPLEEAAQAAARRRVAAVFNPSTPEVAQVAPSEPTLVPNGHNQFGEDKEHMFLIPEKRKRFGDKFLDGGVEMSRHAIDKAYGDS